MTDDPDHAAVELDTPAARRNTAHWWIAAAVAVAAVIGGLVVLSGAWPSPAKLQAASDQSRAEAQIDDAAYGAQLSAARAARAAKSAQAAASTQARATETAAQIGALNADATKREAATSEPAPPN
jgi:hypothetical protein